MRSLTPFLPFNEGGDGQILVTIHIDSREILPTYGENLRKRLESEGEVVNSPFHGRWGRLSVGSYAEENEETDTFIYQHKGSSIYAFIRPKIRDRFGDPAGAQDSGV